MTGLGSRYFSSGPGQPRFRRATDVLMLVPASVGLVLLVVAYPPSLLERSLTSFLATLPSWLDPVWAFLYDLLGLWAIALVVTAVVCRRYTVALEALGALALAWLIAMVAARFAVGEWPALRVALLGGSVSAAFPAIRVAEVAAVVLTIGPQFIRPLQTVGRWVVGIGVFSALLATGAPPGTILAGLLVAAVAAAGVRLAFGTSAGRPELSSVEAALRELGVAVDGLVVAERQSAGVFTVQGTDLDGRPLLVKVYGRDAYDTQLLAKLWRTLWYQGGGPALRLSRGQAVEHEALVTLLARSRGVPTLEVVTAGQTATGDALLVLRGFARRLEGVAADEVDEEWLRRAWRTLALVRDANIANLQIDPWSVAVVGDDIALIDFAGATVAPSADQLQTDRVQLLLTTAAVAGRDRAVRAAVEALGADGIAALLPYLQSAALRTPLRTAVAAAAIDMDDLRTEVAGAASTEVPELVNLRRVTWWTAAQAVLLVLAVVAVIRAAGHVDWPQLRRDLEDASWAWVLLGFVFAQLPRLTQGVGMLGAVAARLPFGPVYIKELATSYLNLAMPSTLARMTVSIRFFQRQGLPAAAAVTAGLIDSLTTTVVEVTLLTSLLLFTAADVSLQFDVPSYDSLRFLWFLLALLVATVLTAVLVAPIRRAIVERVRTWWPQVRSALDALRSGHKLALLLAGNIGTEILFASALGMFALALGSHISLADLLVINISVSLLANFIPVPGGVGVVEFGLTLGLASAGMDQEAALAAVLLYRVSTFYLPPTWGFFAMRWLQRNRYL